MSTADWSEMLRQLLGMTSEKPGKFLYITQESWAANYSFVEIFSLQKFELKFSAIKENINGSNHGQDFLQKSRGRQKCKVRITFLFYLLHFFPPFITHVSLVTDTNFGPGIFFGLKPIREGIS